jgi:outer membrane protein assembly factor BamB
VMRTRRRGSPEQRTRLWVLVALVAGVAGCIQPNGLPENPYDRQIVAQSEPTVTTSAAEVQHLFTWTGAGTDADYQIQISSSAEFPEGSVTEVETDQTELSRMVASDATHHWRVRFRPVGRTDWSGWHGPWTVQVTRTNPGPAPVPPEADATLSDLTVSSGTLSPPFAPGTTSYTVIVPHVIETITVTGTTTQAGATVSAANGTLRPLVVGQNPVTLTVTAPDGSTTKDYTVTVARASDNPPGTHLWGANIGGVIRSSPAVAADGTIYVGSSDGYLYAINPDGTQKWRFAALSSVDSSPAIGADGTVYVGTGGRKLYAVRPDGTKEWEYGVQGPIRSSPAIGADGTIYVGVSSGGYGSLDAVAPNGDQKWSYAMAAFTSVSSSPVIGADGTVYVGSDDRHLYAFDPADGSEKWSRPVGSAIISRPAIGSDGTIYVVATKDLLVAVNPDGSERWSFSTGTGLYNTSSPSVGADGTIYVGSNKKEAFAVSPGGIQQWLVSFNQQVAVAPAIGFDGTVYIGSDDETFVAINPDDGDELWSYDADGWVSSSPTIGPDGTIYFGTQYGTLHAIAANPGGPATTGWPMFGGNARHTGRVD